MAGVHDVITWLQQNGEVKAVDRLRVSLLPDLLGEGIQLATVTPDTSCSPELLKKLSEQATAIAGKPCPV